MHARAESNTPQLLGLYLTDDGQEFLRQLIPQFLREAGFGLSRLADLLIDRLPARVGRSRTNKSPEDLRAEALRKALERWVRGELPRIYHAKSRHDRYVAGIEREMLEVPSIRAVIERHSDTTKKRALGAAFQHFFYDEDESHLAPGALLLRQRLDGLFELTSVGVATTLDLEVARPIGTGVYVNFADIGEPYLLFDMFELSYSAAPPTEFNEFAVAIGPSGSRNHRSGYAYPHASGQIRCIMMDKGPPHRRYFTTWYPVGEPNTTIPTDLQFSFTSLDHSASADPRITKTLLADRFFLPAFDKIDVLGFCRVLPLLEKVIRRHVRLSSKPTVFS